MTVGPAGKAAYGLSWLGSGAVPAPTGISILPDGKRRRPAPALLIQPNRCSILTIASGFTVARRPPAASAAARKSLPHSSQLPESME